MIAIAKNLPGAGPGAVRVNDIHSRLNPTSVADYRRVRCAADLRAGIADARAASVPIAVCGGGHAMGGQQFASDGMLFDTSGMNRILAFDASSGLIEVEAGIQWPQLAAGYLEMQRGRRQQWGIRQKQTGADRLSIGGALAANIHGRVLANKPLIEDVRSFELIDASGSRIECSRSRNRELFQLAIGGYGLFGVIVTVTLQLVPRRKLQRIVELRSINELRDSFASRIDDGYVYGDWQFRIDPDADGFLEEGVFSCYRPLDADASIPGNQLYMTERGWQELLLLAHTDKSQAFDRFAGFYLATSGQLYWSDQHQFTNYLDDYHAQLDARLPGACRGTEMITELYVPIDALPAFMVDARELLRADRADVIYGTVRLIEKDDESFLAWARQDFACIIFNLHVEHSVQGAADNRRIFRRLIDLALRRNGSFFLTYHRYATRRQVELAYPQFDAFLQAKDRYDPDGAWSSDWWRHYASLSGQCATTIAV
ncbi:MAG: FAD-binding oxidoreductase [Gammaproteobacteria bacterium]|nr:FAD-binding oxidoreductase [Gammaproteobacteria bacterium]